MDITAREMLVENVFEPRENIFAGAEYFSRLLKRYGHTIDLALAAYNAGPSNVEKYKGIPPFKETKRYIQKVKKYWRYYRNFR
jgi:soluble lytic murein transglycosylase-like protein